MGFFRRQKSEPGFAKDSYVIVGLGNPGKEYADTRHNMGYKAIDVLSSDENIEIRRNKFHSLIGQGRIAGKKVVLVKPETYMNRSGIAVREAAMYFNVAPENLIVIYDDIDLPSGSIRIRKSGGAGTHNGMKSVVEQLGTKDFVRIRIGVGAAEAGEDLVNRVIGEVPKAERELLQKAAAEAAAAVKDIITIGVDNAMNRHNHVATEKNDN
ncbi:MAG: aminoacyl-tRNA hydrolase [Mogibacterium sp.]|jgi:PTH1 family peptidyl-tRNA hydrolase|nr:aminoacyl-tRNA hydrolase [Mogibacterium sp.]MBR3376157.1 aminoacyl-tRNA hydrolase [Mogibacterium sp.]